MSANETVRVERRAAQRFPVHQPVCIEARDEKCEVWGLIQNLSSSGLLLYADVALEEGQSIGLTFVIPPEITYGDKMKVRCHASVLRVMPPAIGSKSGIAVHIKSYEYLNDVANAGTTEATLQAMEREQEELSASAHVFYPGARA